MTENTYARVKTYMKKYEMIKEHDLVVAGVSGGADSVCLLHILRRLQKEIAFRLLAVHVDHGARADAAADARYVEALCGQLGVPFYLRRADMNGYAARHRLAAEEAGCCATALSRKCCNRRGAQGSVAGSRSLITVTTGRRRCCFICSGAAA